jgi:hypothetical protein
MPAIVTMIPAMMRASPRVPLREPLGAQRRGQSAGRARREDHTHLDRVVAAHDLPVGRDRERRLQQQQLLDRDKAEVGHAVEEQSY